MANRSGAWKVPSMGKMAARWEVIVSQHPSPVSQFFPESGAPISTGSSWATKVGPARNLFGKPVGTVVETSKRYSSCFGSLVPLRYETSMNRNPLTPGPNRLSGGLPKTIILEASSSPDSSSTTRSPRLGSSTRTRSTVRVAAVMLVKRNS
jgi:hypothetical protein